MQEVDASNANKAAHKFNTYATPLYLGCLEVSAVLIVIET